MVLHVEQTGFMSERDRSPTIELWDKQQVATYLGIKPNSVRSKMSRQGIEVAGRRVDGRGRAHSLYRADDIRHDRPTVG